MQFILNVALGEKKNVVAAFAGDLEEAHAAGVAFIREQPQCPVVREDRGLSLADPPDKTIPEQWCPQIYARILKKHKVILVTTYLDREPEILTGMAATGAQFMMFSTGRGAPQGFPTMPVLKVCGNPNTYERMSHDMDINAGRIITGEKSIEEVGEEAFSAILDLLSGKQTKNETLGYHNSIDIYTLGPVI